ncbi:MAG: hypothetical protein CO025_04360 [Ignavibacteria bacterium CG_4_9_14_0_2_um_filter_37_13]|nr:MAG: hypothetical protein CO025_04360 [Ignavibacteria bacterium CG_4_9_14_0_2_um_filter_37_13]
MKTSIYLMVIFFLVFAGCAKQPKEYPNVSIAQVIQDLKWDYNYAKVKNVLETNYDLDFSGEIKLTQGKHKRNLKAFNFEGGKISGLKSQSWTITFDKDTLIYVLITISSETPKQCTKGVQGLREAINNLPYEKFPRINDEWILHQNGKAIGRIQLTKSLFDKGMYVSFSSNKFINKYSYM